MSLHHQLMTEHWPTIDAIWVANEHEITAIGRRNAILTVHPPTNEPPWHVRVHVPLIDEDWEFRAPNMWVGSYEELRTYIHDTLELLSMQTEVIGEDPISRL